MPRTVRLDAPLAWHHVWARGIERRPVFAGVTDQRDFLERLAQLVHAGRLAIYAWALMGNHFHLLAQTGNRSLSSSMRVLLGGYATAFNLRHNRAGHLFQNRFKSTLVDSETYLLELVRYIHLNPLRAGRVASLDALDRYRWTGHGALLGHHTSSWQDCDFILSHFGSTSKAARKAYRAFVGEGLRAPRPDLRGGGIRHGSDGARYFDRIARGREAWSFDERLLGNARFTRSVLDEINDGATPLPRRVGSPQLLAHVVNRLVRQTGCSRAELLSNGKRPDVVRARQALCFVAVRHGALPIAHVARYLGVHPTTVLRAVGVGYDALAQIGCTARDLLPTG